jgi:RimJ/RimL family protein N-acetyltransferase
LQKRKKVLVPSKNQLFIEGRSIKLVPLVENNINQEYLSWLNNPLLNRYLHVSYKNKKQTIADIYNYVNSLRMKDNCELFTVITKKNNVHVGNVGITEYNDDGHGIASFGLLFGDERARKTGLGAEATVLTIEYIFQDKQIRKIKLGANERNESSWRLIENLGFVKEGISRKSLNTNIMGICDVYVYGLLKEEWVEIKPKFSFILNSMKIQDLI